MPTPPSRKPRGDSTPVTGGGLLPDFLRNPALPLDLPGDDDTVSTAIAVLLRTHPGAVNFRARDLNTLDPNTKRLLLGDLYRTLGINPLKRLGP
jgi:hypothetical protein